ncbi:MAG: hypothetical protein QW374_04100 [Candidatus Bathyarchaeia archaeon]|nr:hypothetical protein [Candidatus Bathyarchaeota archaeon]
MSKGIPLVASHRLLLDWLMKHSRRHHLDASSWMTLSSNSKSEAMIYHYFRKLMKRLAERARLRRDV